ncbi:MAG TPA: hypothetical protein VGM06_12270 [Polyangiaceae bacterium]
MLRRRIVGAAVAVALAACSDPDAYTGGGRFETLPGQMGGTLVPADASVAPGDDVGTPPDTAPGESNADAGLGEGG